MPLLQVQSKELTLLSNFYQTQQKMFYVDISLWTCSQSSFVAVLGLIPAPNRTTCQCEPHSTSSHTDDNAVVAAATT